MYLTDTNIFLEVMLSRGGSDECKKLLRMLKEDKLKAAVTDFTIHSIIVLLDRLKKLDALKSFLQSLTAYKRLYIYTTPLHGEIKAIDLAKDTSLDMDGSIHDEQEARILEDPVYQGDYEAAGRNTHERNPRMAIAATRGTSAHLTNSR